MLSRLEDRDRRLAYELAAGVLRRQRALDRVLDLSHTDPRLHDILRLGVYQIRFLSRVPPHAAVSTSVDLAREAAGEGGARYVNRVLRALAGRRAAATGAREASHPRWLVERWEAQFGREETERLLAWNDQRPPLTLQPARWDASTIARRLEEAGLKWVAAPYGAGIRPIAAPPASRLPPPAELPGFAEGGWIVQDPAHALVCRFAAIPAGSLVYDACAAPGGKAVTLERAGARVLAGDARRDRLPRLMDTVRRCGVAIRVVCADLLAAPLAPDSVDAVVLDAPCTATGTMARHPDARWRLRPAAIKRAAALQRTLLDAAARYVRPGGLLVYVTCSLEPEENAAMVNEFLARRRDFARDPVAGAVPGELLTAEGDFFALPPRHGTDGAYAARLRRAG